MDSNLRSAIITGGVLIGLLGLLVLITLVSGDSPPPPSSPRPDDGTRLEVSRDAGSGLGSPASGNGLSPTPPGDSFHHSTDGDRLQQPASEGEILTPDDLVVE